MLFAGHALAAALSDMISDAVIATQDDRADQTHHSWFAYPARRLHRLSIERKNLLMPRWRCPKVSRSFRSVAINSIHGISPFTMLCLGLECSPAMYHRRGFALSQLIAGSADVRPHRGHGRSLEAMFALRAQCGRRPRPS